MQSTIVEWGFGCYFTSFKSESKAAAVLLNNNNDVEVSRKKPDVLGYFVALDITIEQQKITLCSLYGSYDDSPRFYEVIGVIEEFDNGHYILCGGCDLVLNPELDIDQTYKPVNNPKARDNCLEIIDKYKRTYM